MTQPKVTFGFVNCNRLHYLKSCVESLKVCTDDYDNREFIIVDNASVEEGTIQYLEKKSKEKMTVIQNEKRDPSNEFAKALNTIVKSSTGDFIVLLQGDMQFIMKGGWLKEYVDFYSKYPKMIGYIGFDAQRRVTNASHSFMQTDNELFVVDRNRDQFSGAADVMYSREVLEMVGLWSENNLEHEGIHDSETEMLRRVERMKLGLIAISPIVPPSAMIYTDSRGTNARVRGNKRYGDYWPPKSEVEYEYYALWIYEKFMKNFKSQGIPLSIEDIAIPIMWKAPIDESGSWMKNPIKPEIAKETDYVVLSGE